MAETATTARQGPMAKACARLLVVDDDSEIRAMVTRLLKAEGYETERAANGTEALGILARQRPDLVILDVVLEGESGFELLAAIRRSSNVHVILLTGKDAESDRVLGLRLGADDYVTKPFSSAELAARVASVLRRIDRGESVRSDQLEFDDLKIDLLAREVTVADRLVPMTAKEFDLLVFMARSPRQVFSREQLLSHVWDSSSEWQDDGTVTEHIRRVRRKIEKDPDHPKWVHTVRGVGYRFEP